VDHRDVELGRGERTGERGVHVAHHDERVGPLGSEQLLEAHHRRARLDRVRARAHLEVPARLGDGEIAEEDVGHDGVVVLAGVDEVGLVARLAQRGDERADLDEVGAGTNDGDQAHAGSSEYGCPDDSA
jgi:hypothetical protein